VQKFLDIETSLLYSVIDDLDCMHFLLEWRSRIAKLLLFTWRLLLYSLHILVDKLEC
jgi:hypothetical protein